MSNHPEVAAWLNNLARRLEDTGRLSEAEPLHREAIAIALAAVGPAYPILAFFRTRRAGLLRKTDRAEDAAEEGQTALTGLDTALGPEHDRTKKAASVTADALDALGRAGEVIAPRATYVLDRPGSG